MAAADSSFNCFETMNYHMYGLQMSYAQVIVLFLEQLIYGIPFESPWRKFCSVGA
ncbi:hypothetical protein Scep_022602 [Stephania cephalantha]|uniref:Uncharacterized protein n=1 Tax=Stephania cephalantha TaxID=152367 RepID=A0AAP0FG76_9MAGN